MKTSVDYEAFAIPADKFARTVAFDLEHGRVQPSSPINRRATWR